MRRNLAHMLLVTGIVNVHYQWCAHIFLFFYFSDIVFLHCEHISDDQKSNQSDLRCDLRNSKRLKNINIKGLRPSFNRKWLSGVVVRGGSHEPSLSRTSLNPRGDKNHVSWRKRRQVKRGWLLGIEFFLLPFDIFLICYY